MKYRRKNLLNLLQASQHFLDNPEDEAKWLDFQKALQGVEDAEKAEALAEGGIRRAMLGMLDPDPVTATRLLSASNTASSRTTSSTLHSPGPISAGSDGATANCAVSRNRHAEGGAGSSALASGGSGRAISAGRGRGDGTLFAAAKPQVAKPKKARRARSAERSFTGSIWSRITTL